MLQKQEIIEGFPGEYLPSTTYYFSKQSVKDWSSLLSSAKVNDLKQDIHVTNEILVSDRILSTYLVENAGNNLLACLFHENDTIGRQANILSIPVINVESAEKALRDLVNSTRPNSIGNYARRVTLIYTPDRAYSVYKLPPTTLFIRLTGLVESSLQVYAVLYRGSLLLAFNIDSLCSYIDFIDKENVLYKELSYRVVTDGLPDNYNFMLMTDFSRLLPDSQFNVRYVPAFFLRNSVFFNRFIMFAQFTCMDGLIYPNIVLKYKAGQD